MALTLQGGVTKNVVSGVSGAGSGALAGASAGPVGAIVGGLIGAGASLLGNLGNSSSANTMDIKDAYNLEMYNTAKDLFLMNEQNKYNTSTMRYQTDLQKELNQQQFDFQNYFIDNAYQKAVSSMRQAGLNPLLLSGNSPSIGSSSAGSVSALGASVPNSGVDPSSMMTATANSAQAGIAKKQLALNLANTFADVISKGAQSAKAIEEAKTQDSIRQVNEATAGLSTIRKEREEIARDVDKKWLDKKTQAEFDWLLKQGEIGFINAIANLGQSNSSQTSAKALSEVQAEEARIKRARAEWIENHPYQYGFQQTLESLGNVGLVGIGAGLGKGHEALKAHQAKQVMQKSKNVGVQYMKRSF